MEYKKRYLININTKTVHDTSNSKPGCKLNLMQQENAFFCDSLQEALEYPNKKTRRTKPCKFCLRNVEDYI